MFVNDKGKLCFATGVGLLVLSLVILVPLALVQGQDKGQERKRDGDRPAGERKGEGKRKDGDGDQPGLRGTIQKVDLKKGTITVVHRGDGGTTVHKLNLAGKDIKVSGTVQKLTDLRPGLQVILEVSEVNDVVAIRTARAKRRSRVGRIFNTYDKDGNDKVNFKEWARMKEGKFNEARTKLEKRRFDAVDRNRDGFLSFDEFQQWRNPNRPREREGQDRPKRRDGDG